MWVYAHIFFIMVITLTMIKTIMQIQLDDLSSSAVKQLLEQHHQDMLATSPPESVHTLDLTSLMQADVKFWTLWQGGRLAACGAIKLLTSQHGEIKSMRTHEDFRGRGIASILLDYMLSQASELGLSQLSLETGSMAFFKPARALYEKHGFEYCDPFADYELDPHSAFMTRQL